MRRFSQRNPLVTLSDINITPLLDLAFVLLIIFVITTPLLEQGLNLRLPGQGVPDNSKLDPSDVRTVDIDPRGYYVVGGKQVSLDEIAPAMLEARKSHPNLVVYIRGDEDGAYKHVTAVLNRLEMAGLERVSLRTSPQTR